MPLIPLDEARAFVLGSCTPMDAVDLPLRDALGCVLAGPCIAQESVPPFANTAMDGYAVRADDTAGADEEHPVRLRVVDTLHTGRASEIAVGPGEAIRIMTGAPMPDGADAVIMVERTRGAPDAHEVDVLAEVPVGNHVRAAGDDLRPGDEVLAAGATITPARLGVLAMLGIDPVRVHPRVRVGVLSTGDELVVGGGTLGPGQIRDSNRPMLLAAVADSGFEPIDLGCIPDDRDAIEAALRAGVACCDAVISSGGVSMGDVDLVKVVLDEIGDMRWMQVAIKPAKPLAFGTIADGDRRVPVFGLPGNPVSSAVSFELFARPALRQMMGFAETSRPIVEAVADEAFRRQADGKVHFARVAVEYSQGTYHVRSAGGQGSHQLSALANADGLAVLPDGGPVEAGNTVSVLLLR